jgi:hypothetical protein
VVTFDSCAELLSRLLELLLGGLGLVWAKHDSSLIFNLNVNWLPVDGVGLFLIVIRLCLHSLSSIHGVVHHISLVVEIHV